MTDRRTPPSETDDDTSRDYDVPSKSEDDFAVDEMGQRPFRPGDSSET